MVYFQWKIRNNVLSRFFKGNHNGKLCPQVNLIEDSYHSPTMSMNWLLNHRMAPSHTSSQPDLLSWTYNETEELD